MTESEIREAISEREWYHVIDLAPGIRTPGRFDPASKLKTMGFPEDFTGKSVLDIGSSDGFFSFEAEKRGAKSVLATDRHPPESSGFEIARKLLGSQVKYEMTSVYDLSPESHGTFDYVLFPGVFYHLRHPLLALDRIHGVCRETLFLETHVLDESLKLISHDLALQDIHPSLPDICLTQYYPNDELNDDSSNWFVPNVKCVLEMLATSGFSPTLIGKWGHRASFIARREEFTQPFWY